MSHNYKFCLSKFAPSTKCLCDVSACDVMQGCYHTAITSCIHVTVGNAIWWLISDRHAISPAASKQLHNSEKEAPCDEHVKFSWSWRLWIPKYHYLQPELVGHLVRNRWRYTTVIKEWNLCLERLMSSKFTKLVKFSEIW